MRFIVRPFCGELSGEGEADSTPWPGVAEELERGVIVLTLRENEATVW